MATTSAIDRSGTQREGDRDVAEREVEVDEQHLGAPSEAS